MGENHFQILVHKEKNKFFLFSFLLFNLKFITFMYFLKREIFLRICWMHVRKKFGSAISSFFLFSPDFPFPHYLKIFTIFIFSWCFLYLFVYTLSPPHSFFFSFFIFENFWKKSLFYRIISLSLMLLRVCYNWKFLVVALLHIFDIIML